MIPVSALCRLLDHLVGVRLRAHEMDADIHRAIRKIADNSGCDIQDVATLYRIACGEGYEVPT